MLTGKSILHVNQDIGKYYLKDIIQGYYNNMTEKVLMLPELLGTKDLPSVCAENGSIIIFPVAIFQYGLGAYDLFLQTNDERYVQKFLQCIEWALDSQDEQGRWNNFAHYCPEAPFGAMAQGEGASLLIRGYKYTGKNEYLVAAKQAIDFMMKPLEDGGTTKYEGENAFLMEYTFKGMVLNGSIFAWWGLYDYVLATNDSGKYKLYKDQTLKSLISVLPDFKYSYWSKYSLDGLIASPFYHNLHIAQMQAMYVLTGDSIFNDYCREWKRQQGRLVNRVRAFIVKSYQKITE